MAFLDVIERGTFFRLTRIVAFLWLLLLTASTVLSLVLFFASAGHSPGHVAPSLSPAGLQDEHCCGARRG